MKSVVAVFLAALLLGACGAGSNDDALTNAARTRLTAQAREIRNALQSSNPSGAATALADLRRTVTNIRDRGGIGEHRTAEILADAARVESHLALAPTTTTSTTTTTTEPQTDHKTKRGGKQHEGGDG